MTRSLTRPAPSHRSLTVRCLRASLLCAGAVLPVLGTATYLGLVPAPAALAADSADGEQGLMVAKKSTLAPVTLPPGAFRYVGEKEIAQFEDALKTIAAKNKLATGKVEVLVWQGGGAAKKALPEAVKAAGYVYEAQPSVKTDDGKATPIMAVQKEKKQGLIGLMVEQGDTLLLAWTVATPARLSPAAPSTEESGGKDTPSTPATPAEKPSGPRPSAQAPAGAVVFELDGNTTTLNVMKSDTPKVPAFPNVAKKPGFVRGYVYDFHGKPLKGAVIGARSTAAGGFYSGASGKSDEKGYYEIQVPWGAASFYCAGYAVDYGEGRAAMGLYPADGEADAFATPNGAVENWVLMPYGVADRDGIQESPTYPNNYFGGAIVLNAYVTDGPLTGANYLPANSEIEFTLTPDGPLFGGVPARTFVIRKKYTDYFSQLYINNIPVGKYKVSARTVGGGSLSMKETGPYAREMFGLDPKEGATEATLLFRPYSPKPDITTAGHGNWKAISIDLSRP